MYTLRAWVIEPSKNKDTHECYFRDRCKGVITRNVVIMLQTDSALRPPPVHLLDEFSQNF